MLKNLGYIRPVLYIASLFIMIRFIQVAAIVYAIATIIPMIEIIVDRKVWLLRLIHVFLGCVLPVHIVYIGITYKNGGLPVIWLILWGILFLYLWIAVFVEKQAIAKIRNNSVV